MKRIVTSFGLFILCISLLNLAAFKVSAQSVTIYNQNFDSTNHTANLPVGWSATASGWFVDTSGANASTAAYAGASGLNNVEISNGTGINGTYELISNNISTTDYVTLTAEWGARLTKHFEDSGSAVIGFYWSTNNGGAWNLLPYAENGNTSAWSLDNGGSPISLPAGAEHQATLKFKWIVSLASNSSGTYRIDDFNVSGTFSQANGIKTVNAEISKPLGNVFVTNNAINIYSLNAVNEKVNVEVFNVLGNVVKNTTMNSPKLVLNTNGLSSGVYFVKLSTSTTSVVNKVVVN